MPDNAVVPNPGISQRLARRVGVDFPDPGSSAVVIGLLSSISDHPHSGQGVERLQAAIVFKAHGDLTLVRYELEQVSIDFRDVLMGSGLENDGWEAVLEAELGPTRT